MRRAAPWSSRGWWGGMFLNEALDLVLEDCWGGHGGQEEIYLNIMDVIDMKNLLLIRPMWNRSCPGGPAPTFPTSYHPLLPPWMMPSNDDQWMHATTSQSQGDPLYSTVQLADWSNRRGLRLARIAKKIRAFLGIVIGPFCGDLILNQNLLGPCE